MSFDSDLRVRVAFHSRLEIELHFDLRLLFPLVLVQLPQEPIDILLR